MADDPISTAYASAANQLRDRIVALIPAHPEILKLTDAWTLFKIDGFECRDLGPSMAQAQWALGAAKHEWLKAHPA